MAKFKRNLITTALPYANGPVHIGHLAGVYVPADIYVRYLRQKGEEVVFIGGSDEHGVPITIKAQKEGVTPQDIVDRYHQIIKDSFEEFGISFDIYSRTSSKTHHELSSAFFKKLYDEGKFIEKTSMQFYDEKAGQFLADRYIVGKCPHCGNERAYGDQCEACGTSLNATDLIDPVSAVTGNKPELKETKHWYLPLDRYEDWLKEWILEGHKEWKSNVYGQCKSWLDNGLQPRAVTRDLDWGVPVPLDEAKGKVLYVWFDAPIGYISITANYTKEWKQWWCNPEKVRLVQFMGKDNIPFHTVIFPCTLMGTHDPWTLVSQISCTEYLNYEDGKFSKSKNTGVFGDQAKETDIPSEVWRFYLLSNRPEQSDSAFYWEDLADKNNNELLKNLGNFVNRCLSFIHNRMNATVPACGPKTERELKLIEDVNATLQK